MKRILSVILATVLMCSMMVTGASAAYTVELGSTGGTWSFSQESMGTETIILQRLTLGTTSVFPDGTTSVEENSYHGVEETAYLLPVGTIITAINPGIGNSMRGPNDAIFVHMYDLDGHERNQREMKGVSEQIVVNDATLYEIYGLYADQAPGYTNPLYVKGVATNPMPLS